MNSSPAGPRAAPAAVSPPSRRARWPSVLLGATVSLVALWAIAQSTDAGAAWGALTGSHPAWFAFAFATQLGATFFTLRRWQVLLTPYPTRLRVLAPVFFIAHLLNTLLPAKLGTVARVLLAAEEEKINTGLVLGSVAIEKVLDTLVMLVLMLALIPFVPLPEWLRDSLGASVALLLVALIGLAAVGRVREPLLALVARVETRVRGRPARRIADFTRGLLDSMARLSRGRTAGAVLLGTALVWLAGGAVNQLLFAAVGLALPWSAAWFLMVVLQIGTRVPALPANLGVFHYLVILALGVYGVDPSAALAYAILLHLIVFILPALIGAVCAWPVSARLALLLTGRARPSAGGPD